MENVSSELEPSPNRSSGGRFAPGNKGGPGNPHGRQIEKFRSAVYNAVSPQDFTDIVKQLVKCAKKGEAWAVKELFDRVLGKAIQPTEISGKDGEAIQIQASTPRLTPLGVKEWLNLFAESN